MTNTKQHLQAVPTDEPTETAENTTPTPTVLEIGLPPAEVDALVRYRYVSDYLASEVARIEAQLRYVAAQRQELEARTVAQMARAHGVDLAHDQWQLDVGAGVLRVQR